MVDALHEQSRVLGLKNREHQAKEVKSLKGNILSVLKHLKFCYNFKMYIYLSEFKEPWPDNSTIHFLQMCSKTTTLGLIKIVIWERDHRS